MAKLKAFILDSYQEMRSKVSWPKYSELQGSSVLVLIASLMFALIIWVIDLGFSGLLQNWLYQIFE